MTGRRFNFNHRRFVSSLGFKANRSSVRAVERSSVAIVSRSAVSFTHPDPALRAPAPLRSIVGVV